MMTFRDSFKYYKNKQCAPDLSRVLDINNKNNNDLEVMCISGNGDKFVPDLVQVEKWNVYKFKTKPGLILIKNPFTAYGQQYWITRCLRDFSRKPQKLNIDAHNYLENEENWWNICSNPNVDPDRRNFLINKLRWATLGYHHNWDTKVYNESHKDPFPDDLSNLCKYVANVIGFDDFRAEAAIVNYYHMNSTLSGHTDHSEVNLDAPLLSFSFGQSAIFLIGGLTEDCPALPIRIDSGDILIMSKDSRLCYHAIPKILKSPTQPWNEELLMMDKINWQPFADYVETRRINLNVRQVLKSGQNTLDI